MPAQGGLAAKVDQHCVGGIGISAARSENDALIAAAGLAALA